LPATYVWLLIIMLVTILSIYSMHLAQKVKDESGDAGPALVEFGKAFPAEAIRDVATTADDNTIFLRLFDGKVGCVRYQGRTMSCQLLHPGSVSISPSDKPNAVVVEFRHPRKESGEFLFRNARLAAEVSLWLLGSFAASAEDMDAELHPA
jgi:hypothetical protein